MIASARPYPCSTFFLSAAIVALHSSISGEVMSSEPEAAGFGFGSVFFFGSRFFATGLRAGLSLGLARLSLGLGLVGGDGNSLGLALGLGRDPVVFLRAREEGASARLVALPPPGLSPRGKGGGGAPPFGLSPRGKGGGGAPPLGLPPRGEGPGAAGKGLRPPPPVVPLLRALG